MIRLWYAVRDHDPKLESRYSFETVFEIEEDGAANDAADDYHTNHDGWEDRWPLLFVLFDSKDGEPVAQYEVHRDVEPVFSSYSKELLR